MSKIVQETQNIIRDTWRIISDRKAEQYRPALMLVPFAISLILRIPFLFWPEVIYNDSVVYLKAARGILDGKWSETIVPPLYPALVALASFFTGNLEWAGIVVSVVFGLFLFVPVFYLGKELYSARVGMIAALLATVQPYFFRYSGAVLTESVYYFLVASIGFLALKAHSTGKPLWIVSLAFAAAMGYLTRPEAIGFLFVFMVWALLVGPMMGRRSVLRRISIALLAGVCFIAFASPYLIPLRKELGRWELSKKAYVTEGTDDRDAVKTGMTRATWKPKRISLWSLTQDPGALLGIIFPGVFVSLYKFQVALNPLLFLLALWGFTRRRQAAYPWNQHLHLLAFVLFYFALVFPYFKMSARYSSHMIPIALPWAAYGFVSIGERFVRFELTRWVCGRGACIGLIVIMFCLFLQGSLEGGRDHRRLQKEVGLWLKHNGDQSEKVMSSRVHEAFYAEMELVHYEEKDLEGVLEIAGPQRARYVIIDEQMEESHPDFRQRMEHYGMVLLREWKQGRNRIWMYENADSARTSTKGYGR